MAEDTHVHVIQVTLKINDEEFKEYGKIRTCDVKISRENAEKATNQLVEKILLKRAYSS